MAWKFNNESPIYLQIVDAIKMQIAQGILKPGDQVPAVRELAVTAGVNPNTMQKALSELEREGVLYSQRKNRMARPTQSTVKPSITQTGRRTLSVGTPRKAFFIEDAQDEEDHQGHQEREDGHIHVPQADLQLCV